MKPEAQSGGFYPGRATIEAYGNGGFRFAGMSHRGSILCLPDGIHAWAVDPSRPLTVTDLAAVLACGPGVGLLLLGMGSGHLQPPADVRRALSDAGIGLDAMGTGAACRTYNILLGEGRPVAAALLAVD